MRGVEVEGTDAVALAPRPAISVRGKDEDGLVAVRNSFPNVYSSTG